MYRMPLVAVLSSIVVALPAHSALFEGNTVRMSHDFDGALLVGPQDAVVGPGVEGTFFQQYYTVDISDGSIYIAFTGIATFDPSAFNGVRVFDVTGAIPTIGSATVGVTSFSNLDGSRVTYDSDNVLIDLRGINSQGGEFIQVDVLAAPVPEPASYISMLFGLLCAGAAARTGQRMKRVRLNLC